MPAQHYPAVAMTLSRNIKTLLSKYQNIPLYLDVFRKITQFYSDNISTFVKKKKYPKLNVTFFKVKSNDQNYCLPVIKSSMTTIKRVYIRVRFLYFKNGY